MTMLMKITLTPAWAPVKNSHGNHRIIHNNNRNNKKEHGWGENANNYADDGGLKDGNY